MRGVGTIAPSCTPTPVAVPHHRSVSNCLSIGSPPRRSARGRVCAWPWCPCRLVGLRRRAALQAAAGSRPHRLTGRRDSVSAMGEYTIHISTKLINQLARDDEKVKRKVRKPKPKKTVQQREELHVNVKEIPTEQQHSPAPGWPLQPPMFLPVTPAPLPAPTAIPEVEAIHAVLEESEKVLQKLEKQEAEMLQELTKRAKELHGKEFKLPYQNPMPCTVERADCLECYKGNVKNPLKCAEAVKRFAECARLARQSGNAKVSQ